MPATDGHVLRRPHRTDGLITLHVGVLTKILALTTTECKARSRALSPMRSGRNNLRRGRAGPLSAPTRPAPAVPLNDHCPGHSERSCAHHASSRAARNKIRPAQASSVPHSGVTVWWSARLIWVRSPCDPSRKLSTSDSKRFGGTTTTAPRRPAVPGVSPGDSRGRGVVPCITQRCDIPQRHMQKRPGPWPRALPATNEFQKPAEQLQGVGPNHEWRQDH